MPLIEIKTGSMSISQIGLLMHMLITTNTSQSVLYFTYMYSGVDLNLAL